MANQPPEDVETPDVRSCKIDPVEPAILLAAKSVMVRN